ncbi:class I SAM-dependent methyltransferase [Candidatus Nitronereus thalassa]|uniref:Class I SAM-dependent methyltransferase n=1 Tax=Candidatus Nitronereus thalassa TaxID=3020898 RepID=A0ABU3K6V6_9BACT|nr:class I SAM-dependent methyltransferase [Candidatus Nitronereus thalassa]MDT7042099.1 class I SAM-dependent methyltransferase [Candidatus Nitronereus thalassa]
MMDEGLLVQERILPSFPSTQGLTTLDNSTQWCWVCKSSSMTLVKRGAIPENMSGHDYRITDATYGLTADIFQCGQCGFRQCSDLVNVLQYYEEMEDDEYEATRAERAIQANTLLKIVERFKPRGRLLDVGAGSGIFVEQAQKAGFTACGVEPSRSLHAQARQRGLPVTLGALPHDNVTGPFDVVTLVDVIEHVPNPIEVTQSLGNVLADDGVCLIATPDIGSVAARLMGWRWWHYRLAHIGYFNRSTLRLAMKSAGMDIIHISRPTWYFTVSYLATRVLQYVPAWLRPPIPKFFDRIMMPLNLFDSWLIVCRKSC